MSSTGVVSCGVTMMISSVCWRWKSAERNSAPSTGRFARPGNWFERVVVALLEQAGDGEALAVAQLDRGRGLAGDQARQAEAVDGDAVRRVQLADLGRDLQPDLAVVLHRRGDLQLDAIVAELDRHAVQTVGTG